MQHTASPSPAPGPGLKSGGAGCEVPDIEI